MPCCAFPITNPVSSSPTVAPREENKADFIPPPSGEHLKAESPVEKGLAHLPLQVRDSSTSNPSLPHLSRSRTPKFQKNLTSIFLIRIWSICCRSSWDFTSFLLCGEIWSEAAQIYSSKPKIGFLSQIPGSPLKTRAAPEAILTILAGISNVGVGLRGSAEVVLSLHLDLVGDVDGGVPHHVPRAPHGLVVPAPARVAPPPAHNVPQVGPVRLRRVQRLRCSEAQKGK